MTVLTLSFSAQAGVMRMHSSSLRHINAGDLQPAVPADPEASSWYDYGEYGNNYGSFYFSLPKTDVDGNYIDQYYLSYSIYTDYDQIYTFKASDFPDDLTEDVTEVTSSIFFNSWNLSAYGVYLYYDEAPLFDYRVGIQVHYTINGVTNSSNIVYWNIAPIPDVTSVNELNGGKQVATVRYYNLAGQQVAQPSGLTIQVTTFTDGTSNATKVIK